MGSKHSFKLHGYKKAMQKVKSLKEAAASPSRVIMPIAWSALEAMKTTVPVDTGALRWSLRIADEGEEMGRAWATLATRQRYAGFVEFGTRRQKAQPYFFPAIDRARVELRNTLEQLVKKG